MYVKVYVKRDEEKEKERSKVMAEFLQPQRDKQQDPRGPQDRSDWVSHREEAEEFLPHQGRPNTNTSSNQLGKWFSFLLP